MKRESLLPRIGVTVLLLAFAGSALLIATRIRRVAAPGTVTLRLAHFQLEGGIREAFTTLARRYMDAHPGVVIEQLPIPGVVYGSWLRTQLVGGTAPDIVEFGQLPTEFQDELLARHFVPLTGVLEEPNPYNRGTSLENIPWRETFIDGLDIDYRSSNLKEYYLIPTAMMTERVYYNRTLWRQVLGDTPLPTTFAQFRLIAAQVEAHAKETDRLLVPLAGSVESMQALDRLFASQTQRLHLALDLDRNLIAGNIELAVGWLQGRWSSDSPEFQRGLELENELAGMLTPGFVNLTRGDATFLFLQQRALMIFAGSWDYISLTGQSAFPIGVFSLPVPATDDPVYGASLLGAMSELEQGGRCSFAMNAASAHPELALDFLRFLGSREGNRLFMEKSHWLPALIDIAPPDHLRDFMPVTEGYPRGFDPHFFVNIGTEVRRLWETHLDRLVTPTGGVEAITTLYRDRFGPALREDLARLIARSSVRIIRQDSMLAALTRLRDCSSAAECVRVDTKRSEIFQHQNAREAEAYWVKAELSAATATKASP